MPLVSLSVCENNLEIGRGMIEQNLANCRGGQAECSCFHQPSLLSGKLSA